MVVSRFTTDSPSSQEIDIDMRFSSFSFRRQRVSDEEQPVPPSGPVQFGPPNKPVNPPPTKPTKPIKKLRESLGNVWPFDGPARRQPTITPSQLAPPDRPTKPPANPPTKPKKQAPRESN